MTALWRPTQREIEGTALEKFRVLRGAEDYATLHRASVEDREAFWRAAWDFLDVIGANGAAPAVDLDRMPGTRWFPAADLSFAENLMARNDDATAIIYRDESGARHAVTFRELRRQVAVLAAFLRGNGLKPGDRVAAIAPNRIETVVCMLATNAIGGVFSACSPDFGPAAIIDRFGQIGPRILIGCNAYRYGGKRFACLATLNAVIAGVNSVESVLLIRTDSERDECRLDRPCFEFGDVVTDATPNLRCLRQGFDAPLYIMFSSGTTGVPKCIVHGQGGTLLKHRVEHALHCDFRSGERVLFFTTCGWMMWNWLVSALANGSTVCLYDGSPFHPDPGVLWRFVEDEGVCHLGLSPGLLSALAKNDYRPANRHRLNSLRSLLSTGSPLPATTHRWAYEHVAPVRLSSITGGTDIIGCFALGNPCLPVYAGEIQCAALGMDVAFLDDDGNPLRHGKGELVCRRSFPSMPVGFWNDADGAKYRSAYFERFPGIWHHGDFGEFTEHDGVVIHGRSDAVLNRGGVRIGTAEIYRQVERIDEVLESIAVALEKDADVELVLFVRVKPTATLSDELEARIRSAIRSGASPRHVPDRIIAVADIPRTRSGKLTEIAVRDVLHGRTVRNVGALANPEALELFRNLRLR